MRQRHNYLIKCPGILFECLSFVISKTHISGQKLHGRQLNAKVCGNESAIFLILLCSDHLSNNDNLKTAQALTLILAQN